jgi:hypothetical protein
MPVLCAAGLLSGLALACKQMAALLQQQQQQPQETIAAVLAKLQSRAAAYCLLDVWCWLVQFAPMSASNVQAVLGSLNFVPTIIPVCKLARAAAYSAMPAAAGDAAAGAASSSNSRSRLNSGSSSSSGVGEAGRLAVSHEQLMQRVMAVASAISACINNEYENDWQPPGDESVRWVEMHLTVLLFPGCVRQLAMMRRCESAWGVRCTATSRYLCMPAIRHS